MARGNYIEIERIINQYPELKKHIPYHNNCKVGISNSGNIKYIYQETMYVIPQTELNRDLYMGVKTFISNELARKEEQLKENIKNNLKNVKFIPKEKLAALNLGLHVPKNAVTDVYVKPWSTGFYCAKATKKNKKNEVQLKNIDHEANGITNEFAVRLCENFDHLDEIIDELNNNRTDFLQAYEEMRSYTNNILMETTATANDVLPQTIAALIITDCGIWYRCKYQSEYYNDLFRVRMDKPFRKDAFASWIYNCENMTIANYNHEEEERAKENYKEEVIKAVCSLLKSNERLNNIRYAKEKTNYCINGIINREASFSIIVKYHFAAEEQFFDKKYLNGGVLVINLSDKGKNQINLIAKKLYEEYKSKEVCISNTIGGRAREVKNKGDEIILNYKKMVRPLYIGKQKTVENNCKLSYSIQNDVFTAKSQLSVVKSGRDGSVSIKTNKEYKELKQLTSLKSYKSAIAYFNEQVKDFEIIYMSGAGVLFGSTFLQIRKGHLTVPYEWNCNSFKGALTEWKRKADKNIREIKEIIHKAEEDKRIENIRKAGIFAGNYIAQDIAKFIIRNEKYITENAMISYLRGLSVRFGGDIENTDAYGRYKLMSSDELEGIINGMIRAKHITTKTLKGTYGRFDILKPADSLYGIQNGDYEKLNNRQLKELLNGETIIKDCYAEDIFNILLEKKDRTIKDYMTALQLISSKGFICRKYHLYIEFFKKAPSEIKEYIKMKREMTNDKFEKKILLELKRV